jgi:hypothetical protein
MATFEDQAQTSSTINKLKDMLNFGKKPATEEVGAGATLTLKPQTPNPRTSRRRWVPP